MKNEIKKISKGDTVETYCCGEPVEGEVVEVAPNYIVVSHKPVRWGKDTYTSTIIQESTNLQSKICPTTPRCTVKGEQIYL